MTSIHSKRKPHPPFKEHKQKSPGLEKKMNIKPKYHAPQYKAAGKLIGKRALITGGDSGIGRAVALLYAREGASVLITYLPEERVDAEQTQSDIQEMGGTCVLLSGDLTKEAFCKKAVAETVKKLGGIDILVSNAAHQMRKDDISEITTAEFDRTFKTNVYAYFHLAKAAVPHMKPGSCIIATSSETSTRAPEQLLDYSSTKGAINTFTKSLAQMLVKKGIRVNAVAPGPVWTPLNPSDEGTQTKKIKKFGEQQPIGRAAQPEEIAPAYVFLASEADSSYVSGVILPEMGAEPI
ncbi:SDR family oxidoreductase [Bdellovibrio sp. SKB1291214]|uniref:SDR family oxidoreductase n=1 Tax=Bdellovibrio sp. SKB1291214 TaxID=1732569 RepID=UPI00223F512B|nr:SDR family oxidoreductase [Bdellovibrio sp. SKB1291214]UYL07249.1 SDR family oxidoreductase [Bdellovibrio sp. SKB1291214]